MEEAIPAPQKGQVLVRRAFAGVNASDVNFTSGRYFGTPEQSAKQLPFYAGFEAVGVVAAVGEGVKGKFSLSFIPALSVDCQQFHTVHGKVEPAGIREGFPFLQD